MYRISAYNRLTGERMYKPERPSLWEAEHISEWLPLHYAYISEMKVWDAFIESLPETFSYVRPKLRHATEKGIPVPRTGSYGRRKYKNGAGVSANSRVLSHHYRDEGERGQAHRREIKRKERAMWLSEWQREQEQEDAYSVADWFTYDPYEWDYYYGENDYDPYDRDDYCETCNGPCEL